MRQQNRCTIAAGALLGAMARLARHSATASAGRPTKLGWAALALFLVYFLFSALKIDFGTFRAYSWFGLGPSSQCQPFGSPAQPLPGTMPMKHPSWETYKRIQADPSLPERRPRVAAEFEAAPWLLPARTPALNYAGIHDLDKLAKLRAARVGRHPQALSVLLFSRNIAAMAQNTIYSLVKFGGVRNYLVCVWSDKDLEACADLNLPCASVAHLMAEPLMGPPPAKKAYTLKHDSLVIKWLRPAIVHHLVSQGYAVHWSDADVVYTLKPVWESYVQYIDETGGEGAVQDVDTRGGSFVMLPTPGIISMLSNWTASASSAIQAGKDDVEVLDSLAHATHVRCGSPLCSSNTKKDMALRAQQMAEAAAAASGNSSSSNSNRSSSSGGTSFVPPAPLPVLRTYRLATFMTSDDGCFLKEPDAPLVDVCDWAVLYLHPPCLEFNDKKPVLQDQGLWLMDDLTCMPPRGSSTGVLACQPLRWRVTAAEHVFYSCLWYGLGLIHRREQPTEPP